MGMDELSVLLTGYYITQKIHISRHFEDLPIVTLFEVILKVGKFKFVGFTLVAMKLHSMVKYEAILST